MWRTFDPERSVCLIFGVSVPCYLHFGQRNHFIKFKKLFLAYEKCSKIHEKNKIGVALPLFKKILNASNNFYKCDQQTVCFSLPQMYEKKLCYTMVRWSRRVPKTGIWLIPAGRRSGNLELLLIKEVRTFENIGWCKSAIVMLRS